MSRAGPGVAGSEAYDVAVVGAGPAGSALAASLARAGGKIALLEKDRLPRDKLCGEVLSPEASASLERLGCLERVLAAGPARLRVARFTLPGGARLELPLPGEGLGLSRRVLDDILLRHAVRSGVAVHEGMEVRAVRAQEGAREGCLVLAQPAASRGGADRPPLWLSASLVACAHGRGGRLDHELERRRPDARRGRIGFKRHCRPAASAAGERLRAELDGTVEVHVVRGGYCGLAPIEDGLINVCCLVEPAFVRSLPATGWPALSSALAAGNAVLRARLEHLEPAGELLSVAGVHLEPRECWSDTTLFLGDAAGMIAPFCGDGQAMALRSALILAELIGAAQRGSGDRQSSRLGPHWQRRFGEELGARLRWGRWLDGMLRRPLLARSAFAAIRRCPPLGSALVRRTRGPE